jgi:hypothetical protein
MTQRTRLAIVGAVLLSALACRLTTGPTTSPVNTEATVVARVNAALTAEAHSAAAAHVTETVTATEMTSPAPTGTPITVPPPTETSAPTPPPTSTSASPGSTPTPLMPVIAYFTCEPCIVEPGGAATLSWDLSGATAAYLDGQGIVAPGSTVVHPDQTTTYRLVAVNDHGQSEKTVTVQVSGLPTIHYFTCLPCEVTKGQQATLSWDLSGATAAYLDGQGVTAPGDTVVAPDQTTTYRLVAVGERGSVERLVTVTVKEGGDPETVRETLSRLGYEVRSVGYLPLAAGGNTISVIMPIVTNAPQSQEVADQCFWGFKTLYDNYPDQVLTVGLYDGVRYIVFVTVEPAVFESFLRGEMDGRVFWQVATWNVWDEWRARWLTGEALSFARQNFMSSNFGF